VGYWKGSGRRKIRAELFLEEGEKVVLCELREGGGRGLGEVPEGRGRGVVIHLI